MSYLWMLVIFYWKDIDNSTEELSMMVKKTYSFVKNGVYIVLSLSNRQRMNLLSRTKSIKEIDTPQSLRAPPIIVMECVYLSIS